MTAPQSLHRQLIEQARLLAEKEPKRPKQAAIRRSISASYYLLFHFLIFEATRRIVGTAHSNKLLRQSLSRSFAHQDVVKVAKKFTGTASTLPAHLHPIISANGSSSLPAELVAIGAAFTDLQEARHQADYNLNATFSRGEALTYIDQAEDAMQNWSQMKGTPAADLFLFSLLAWKGILRT